MALEFQIRINVVQLTWFLRILSSLSSRSKQYKKYICSSWTAWLWRWRHLYKSKVGNYTPNEKTGCARRRRIGPFEKSELQRNVWQDTVMKAIERQDKQKWGGGFVRQKFIFVSTNIWDTAVGVANRLRTRRSGGRIPVSPTNFSVLQNIQNLPGAHWAPYFMITGVISQG